jgi:hypothetical protein
MKFLSSNTLFAKLIAKESTTSEASLNIPHGVAPTTLSNGDIWTTTSGLYARINGATIQLATTEFVFNQLAFNMDGGKPSSTYTGTDMTIFGGNVNGL